MAYGKWELGADGRWLTVDWSVESRWLIAIAGRKGADSKRLMLLAAENDSELRMASRSEADSPSPGFCSDPQFDTGFLLKRLDDLEKVLSAGVTVRGKHAMQAFAWLVKFNR